MLTLSAVIAAGGILTDSTATVIGAMIIAPLSTPIMGIALGAVERRRATAALFVALGCLLVLLVGACASLVVPRPTTCWTIPRSPAGPPRAPRHDRGRGDGLRGGGGAGA
ncbi:DUF389 domain-containing protein [Streptomyces zhihengii]